MRRPTQGDRVARKARKTLPWAMQTNALLVERNFLNGVAPLLEAGRGEPEFMRKTCVETNAQWDG